MSGGHVKFKIGLMRFTNKVVMSTAKISTGIGCQSAGLSDLLRSSFANKRFAKQSTYTEIAPDDANANSKALPAHNS